ncbi:MULTISPECIES: hypothetical protein [unclassified Leeuwenhoekiella]|uniref:hypothetical protein n=1 Tax=unclassified Leeuwenhoekiella TaxID=2615029 RepID=UPI000C486B47|nr:MULTISPECIES: hypothetical protein [unclassified Leeuwenhoekiella]MAW96928.1 hypothetical protein [Leeuwenhoekiella sp.]MBA80632.1 hypothetical protein [Leeuwenhoekiella sp.]|tara:strand:+ start:3790 stop:5028 length:1239 start_codon:yes stop_codon:yes gene_type:complete
MRIPFYLWCLIFILFSSFAPVSATSKINPEVIKRKSVLALMVDKVAQNYFQATEALGQDIPDFDSSRVKLLLEGMHQATEQMVTLTAEQEWQERIFRENSTFHEIRQLTLLNLNRAKQNLINAETKTSTASFTKFITILDAARSFCDQLMVIDGKLERVAASRKWTVTVEKSTAEKFEESMGADNITMSQWLGVMEWGGDKTATEDLREMGRKNQAFLLELKKKERALIKTGAVEQVQVYTDTVDGVVYRYADFPPQKWSFIYTPDRDLVKGLVSWLVYINSGNSVKLSDVLSLGLSNALFDPNVYRILETSENSRLITDTDGNQVRLILSGELVETLNLSKLHLKRVTIEDDQIIYFGNYKEADETPEGLQPVLSIQPVQGDLFRSIKMEIERLRLNPGEYHPSNLRLNTY